MADARSCILGCAQEYKVVVMNRCGTQQVCELTNVSDLIHGRVLDDTSEAIATVSLKGEGLGDSCCDCLGGVRSWIHSMMIMRDGELVWGPGPIVNIRYMREQVVVTARDVSAWLDVRYVHDDLDFVEEDPLVVAQSIINDAMAPDDPCDIAGSTFVQVPPVLGSIDREYTMEDPTQYAGDMFRELANTVMDFTVVGNQILMGEPLTFGPFVTLTDADFQVEIEVEERGLETGTRWTVQSEEAFGSAGGKDKFYGLIEQIDDDSTVEDDDQAVLIAEDHRKGSNPAPLYINVPEGARLSPEAPVCYERLVPGTLVNVALQDLCRKVTQQMKLTAVRTHVGEDGDEEVGVTLSPITHEIPLLEDEPPVVVTPPVEPPVEPPPSHPATVPSQTETPAGTALTRAPGASGCALWTSAPALFEKADRPTLVPYVSVSVDEDTITYGFNTADGVGVDMQAVYLKPDGCLQSTPGFSASAGTTDFEQSKSLIAIGAPAGSTWAGVVANTTAFGPYRRLVSHVFGGLFV